MTEPAVLDLPELRPGPPWVMEEMIAAEPALAEPILGSLEAIQAVADAVRRHVGRGRRITVVGCGTSEHGAMAIAALIDRALVATGGTPGTVRSRQAFEAALEASPDGLVIGVSHEGETPATVAALAAARALGAETALVTANPRGPAAAEAGHVFATPLVDRSWCHTVGYLSPVLAGAAVASALSGVPSEGPKVASYMKRLTRLSKEAAKMAKGLAGADRVVVCGSGTDRIAARELALKIEEGVRIPAVGRDLETELHGHLVSADERCGMILIATDPDHAGPRTARALQALLAGRRLGMPTAAITGPGIGDAWDADATSAGRLQLPDAPGIPTDLAAILGAGIALQLLTVALVHQAGTNPDRIGRELDDQRESAEIVSASFEV